MHRFSTTKKLRKLGHGYEKDEDIEFFDNECVYNCKSKIVILDHEVKKILVKQGFSEAYL